MLSKTPTPFIALAAAAGLGEAGALAGLLAAMGLGMFGLGALRLPGWARRRKTQIDDVLARLTPTTTRVLP